MLTPYISNFDLRDYKSINLACDPTCKNGDIRQTKTGENDFFQETGGTVELDAIRGGTGQISLFEENNKSISQSDNSFDNFFLKCFVWTINQPQSRFFNGPLNINKAMFDKKKNGETSKIWCGEIYVAIKYIFPLFL